MVFPDFDPTLAAEPGFGDRAPQGVRRSLGQPGHVRDALTELLPEQCENLPPVFLCQPHAAVVVEVAGRLAEEAAQAALIQRKAKVLVYSSLSDEIIRAAHLTPCRDISAAVRERLESAGPAATVAVLPQGPLTIPYLA